MADHPAFRNVVQTYAGLFGLQHDPRYRDVLTYPSPATGEPVATSFLVPRVPADLDRRQQAYKVWAFSRIIVAYYEKVRDSDLLCTHALIPPQANRALPASQQAGGTLMAHIVREDDNGIVVRGARMLATIGPFADELLVFPSTVLRGVPEDKPYSFAFAIPADAKGLRFIAREPFDRGGSHFDHPLESRFDESDAVVAFDDVHVPYERCFTLGDPELCNGFCTRTDALAHMTHQVVTRTTAKTEYILGLTALLTESIGIGQFPHVQADLAEIITALETLRALRRAAEADAAPNAYGVLTPAWPPLSTARNLYEYYFFGDPVRTAGAYVASYDKTASIDRVREFLSRG